MTYRQWSLIVFLGALWGASFLFMRISVPEVGPLFTGAMRVVFAGVFLGMVALAVGQAGHWENKKKMAFFSLINSAIPFSLFSFAANYLPAGYLSVLNAMAPMLGLLIGIFFYQVKHSLKMWVGICFGMFGVISLTALGPIHIGMWQLLSLLAGVIGAFCYALTGYWAASWFPKISPIKMTFQNQVMASCWLLPLAGASGLPTEVSTTSWGALFGLGVICTGFAYFLYNRLIREIGAVKTSSIAFLIPCFAIGWSWLFLNEQITQGHVLGVVCIILAVRWTQPGSA